MSALKDQLAALSTIAKSKATTVTPSLLFSKQEAGDIDVDTLHAIGCNGLMGLVDLSRSFSTFQESLFSETLKNTDRSLLVKYHIHIQFSKVTTTIPTFAFTDPVRACRLKRRMPTWTK
jgi:hypothetical protein